MKNRLRVLSVLLAGLVAAACGGIQKARYYQPASRAQDSLSREWGDGLAVADQDICVWIGDASGLRLPMMAGPIGLPIFPLGVLAGDQGRPEYFDLAVWVVPAGEEQVNRFRFDVRSTYLDFGNGLVMQPQFIQISRFRTDWKDGSESIALPEHQERKPIAEYSEAVVLWEWSRFTMRFEKPGREVAPQTVRIEGLSADNRERRIYEFTFREVTKYRYLVSGHHPNGEWGIVSEATPCRDLFKEMKN